MCTGTLPLCRAFFVRFEHDYFYWFKPVQHRMAAISIREAMPIQRANALESRKASWPQGVKHSKTKDEAGRT